jgi:hypothetical protein
MILAFFTSITLQPWLLALRPIRNLGERALVCATRAPADNDVVLACREDLLNVKVKIRKCREVELEELPFPTPSAWPGLSALS